MALECCQRTTTESRPQPAIRSEGREHRPTRHPPAFGWDSGGDAACGAQTLLYSTPFNKQGLRRLSVCSHRSPGIPTSRKPQRRDPLRCL